MNTALKMFFLSWLNITAYVSLSQPGYGVKMEKVYGIEEDSAKCLVVLILKKNKFPFDSVVGKMALVTYMDSIEPALATLTGKPVRIKRKLMKNKEVLQKENIRYCMTQSPYFTDFNFGPKGFDFACLLPDDRRLNDGNFMLKSKCAIGKKRIRTGNLPKGRYMMVAVSESRKAYAYLMFVKWR